MSKIQVFKDYKEFCNRKDKSINGVSQDFLEMNEDNPMTIDELNLVNCEGCWNCYECQNCINCIDCVSCIDCQNCINCLQCINCNNCKYCQYIEDGNGCDGIQIE
ncbi:MAG: hypothetical protein FWC41_06530 [Firmicutes bacterium]|nr:hypothetical protein [Bacillota bacterium]